MDSSRKDLVSLFFMHKVAETCRKGKKAKAKLAAAAKDNYYFLSNK